MAGGGPSVRCWEAENDLSIGREFFGYSAVTLTLNGGCAGADVPPGAAEHCSRCPQVTWAFVPRQPRYALGWGQVTRLPGFTACLLQRAVCFKPEVGSGRN